MFEDMMMLLYGMKSKGRGMWFMMEGVSTRAGFIYPLRIRMNPAQPSYQEPVPSMSPNTQLVSISQPLESSALTIESIEESQDGSETIPTIWISGILPNEPYQLITHR